MQKCLSSISIPFFSGGIFMLQQAFNFNNVIYNTLFPRIIYPLAGFSMTGIILFFLTQCQFQTFLFGFSFNICLFVSGFWEVHLNLSCTNWQFLCDQKSSLLHIGDFGYQCHRWCTKIFRTHSWSRRRWCFQWIFIHWLTKKSSLHYSVHIMVQIDGYSSCTIHSDGGF